MKLTDEYYTINEVAEKLKVTYLTVYRWIRSEKLKSNKAGKQYRIKQQDIKKFIKRKESK